MTPIDSLSAELLKHVLRLEVGMGGAGKDKVKREHRLQDLCFVCRGWRPAAQSLLWTEVCLKDDKAAKKFLAAKKMGVKWPTREIYLANVRTETAEEVLRSCEGLRDVRLNHMQVDLALLSLPSMSGAFHLFRLELHH